MKRSILILEDKTDACKIYLGQLDETYNVSIAFNCSGARDLAKTFRYDALIVDINLGKDEESGDSFALEYQQRYPETLVYIATGLKHQLIEGIKAKVFEKPLSIPKLTEQIKKDFETEPEKETMNYASREELNGYGERLRGLETSIAGCQGNMGARMESVENAQIETREHIGDLKTGQNRIIGAVVGLNGFVVLALMALGVYVAFKGI